MVPEPRANPLLLGHEAAEATLLDAMRVGPDPPCLADHRARRRRQGDAGLPLRPPAAGRAAGGQSLALDPSHPVFRRVAAGAHADLQTVERAYDEKRKRMRTQIAVEDVRRISAFMSLTPAEGGWRVAIVDGAEELNQSSANALLKILEEPPPRAILLLVCARPGGCCRPSAAAAGACASIRCRPSRWSGCWRPICRTCRRDERGRLVTLAEGSPAARCCWREEEGLAIAGLVDEVLAALPGLKPPRALCGGGHTGARRDRRSPTSWTCCAPGIAAAVRDVVRGGRIPSSRGWSRCVPLMPGATCGTR